MLKLEFLGRDLNELLGEMWHFLSQAGHPGPAGLQAASQLGVPAGGNGSGMGEPIDPAIAGHWEQARPLGWRQGYQRAVEAYEREALLRTAERQRPKGCKDYMPAPGTGDEPENQAGPSAADAWAMEQKEQNSRAKVEVGPDTDFEAMPESNRKAAVDTAEQQAAYYGERETPLQAQARDADRAQTLAGAIDRAERKKW